MNGKVKWENGKVVSKYCPGCKQFRDACCFSVDLNRTHGLQSRCRNCKNIAHKHYTRKYRETHPSKYKWREKFIVVAHYSMGEMCCKECRNSDIRCLQVDHINGCGTKHRQTIKGLHIYRWLIKNDFPEGFQILCANHNAIKRIENQECGNKEYQEKRKNPVEYQLKLF